MDGGAWWAAVHGVPKSQTWLKWLSSSRILFPRPRMEPVLPLQWKLRVLTTRPSGNSLESYFKKHIKSAFFFVVLDAPRTVRVYVVSMWFLWFFLFSFCIGIYPVNNVVIILGEQQRNSAMYMHPFSPKLPSHPDCHVTLSRVPCAV